MNEWPKMPVLLLLIALASALGSGIAFAFANGIAHTSLFSGKQSSAYASSCNVLGIQVYGTIVTNRASIQGSGEVPADASSSQPYANYTVSNTIEDTLRSASTDPSIKALLIDVDSPGGGPVAGEEIAAAIRKSGKPSVAVIHEMGASSGYLVASAADTIFASENSNVGSIGVTSSYLNYAQKDQKDGIVYEELSSGPFKDTGSPDKPLTQAERDLIMRDIKISYDRFVQLVAGYRHQPVEKIAVLADGSTMLGKAALDNGLIDRIGTTWDAIDYLQEKLGEPVTICWQ